ncbi:MAG: DUF5979 domain-containing protein [Clostridium sp.]|uniref:DUF7601 domain-containing protein n=1 Tax=Clostridium sp. TaxID=1506 RepID=UPI002A74AF0A|nr:DUF5979 domain-containing protein [Clostridium sp.]MDY2630634.1 DUF5979 domain-containing protein [Clostridium sp.]
MKLLKKLLTKIMCLLFILSLIPITAFANESSFEIFLENEIHYIDDPSYPQESLVVYCMNNLLNWPHTTEKIPRVPNYTYGYLDADSIENYDEMSEKIKKVLFAGYPYNGKNLYKIVEIDQITTPSEAEFNDILKPPAEIANAFPELGQSKLTLNNFNENDTIIKNFFLYVLNMSSTDVIGNLTKADITSTPFYKALYCLYNFNNPIQQFAVLYSSSYYVTEKQAYDNTQNAIWKILNDYKVPNNNINDIEVNSLASVLINYSNSSDIILENAPANDVIEVTGDLTFKMGSDGRWYSGKLRINEPEGYNGIYSFDLPDGISLLDINANTVYGNKDYVLVSDHLPKNDEIFSIWSYVMWISEPRQYSPVEDIQYNGKKFQHMVGLYANRTYMSAEFTYGNYVGDLIVSKTVLGDNIDTNKEFTFTVTLSDNTVNGTYGDIEFINGVSTFTLKHNQNKLATGLPLGINYNVIETNNEGYYVSSENATGSISSEETSYVRFTNTIIPVESESSSTGNLSVHKTVLGNNIDTNKEFTFTVTLSDNTINGTYGDMEFINGVSTFTLKHNQNKLATGLPLGVNYNVIESDNEGYSVSSEKAIGSISSEETAYVRFTNTIIPSTGNLSVHKTVLGDNIDTNKEFTFTVTLSDNTVNGTYGDMEFINGVSTFKLKHNESKQAVSLPKGITYTVTESDNEGYSVSSENDIGSISSEETAYVRFSNTIIPVESESPSTGSMSVRKTVLGTNIDVNREFTFTVTLSDNTINGTYGDITFTNGVSIFKLKHNEIKNATGLPIGLTYTVTESDNEGYSVSSKNSVGNITKDNVIVDFENTLTILFEVPHTADNSNAIMWIATLIISSIGILSIIALKNRYL